MMVFSNLAEMFSTSICLIAHAKKDLSDYRGSTAIGAAVDVLMEMKTDMNRRSATTKIVGRVDVDEPVEHWRWLGSGEGYVSASSAPLKLSDKMIAVLKFMDKADGPVKRSNIQKNISISKSHLTEIKKKLAIETTNNGWFLPKKRIRELLGRPLIGNQQNDNGDD